MVGSEAGIGGRVREGTVGMVGNVGFGEVEGIWVLGRGGNVAFGKFGIVGSETAGIGGRVRAGTVGMVGNVGFGKVEGIWVLGRGGSVALGNGGREGRVCSSWRAARLVWMLENVSTTTRHRTKLPLKEAIV